MIAYTVSGSKTWRTSLYFVFVAVLLGMLFLGSLMIGPAFFALEVVGDYLFHYSEHDKNHLILHMLRMPRALAVLTVGASLAVAGCIMQAITRNPLASPGVFGVNSGASFMVILCMVLFPNLGGWLLAGFSFAGGLLAVLMVLLMSALIKGGRAEVRMALIGIMIQAVLSSFTQGLLIFNEESAGKMIFWLAGSVIGVQWEELGLLIPVSIICLLIAFTLSRSLSLLSLGEEVAQGLGQRIWLLRISGSAVVIMLAGVSVAVCGPIGFVGLIVPHIARFLVGNDYRLVLPFSALLGGCLLTLADIASRFISFPAETPVGIVTALIGAPYFVYLAKRQDRSMS
ncbi:iron ABC transporter permease [Neobacillus mesonae]|nr:iron ABC transporter permease [Neobacillus mesonae]